MSNRLPHSSQPTRNHSDELDVFEAARYFSGANENLVIGTHQAVSGEPRNLSNNTQKSSMRPFGRMSLDMPNHREKSIPLQAMIIDNPMMIKKEIKKSKQPSSPGGKLAHFLNSLFSQTSSKKPKTKSKSTNKDEDESPNSWRRKRRSSISHFTSANNSNLSDSRSQYSNSISSSIRTSPHYHMIAHTPTKTSNNIDTKSYSYSNPPPSQITKIPINGNLNKIENKHTSVEKVNIFDYKQGHDHPDHKYILKEDIKKFKRFIKEDDGDSDSSSDLFELKNCDLGYYNSSGLPVYETTHMDSIKRDSPS